MATQPSRSPIGIIFLTVFISMVGFGIVIPVLPVYAKSEPFLLNPTQLGWLVGIFSLVQLFAAPLFGKLSDRIGRKPVLLVSVIGTAVGFFVIGKAEAAWMLFLGRIIDGGLAVTRLVKAWPGPHAAATFRRIVHNAHAGTLTA